MPCVQQDHISQWQGWGTQKAMQLVQAHVHLMQNNMQWQRIWISMCKEIIICPCCGSICKTVNWNTCFWETTAVFELDIKAKRSCVPLHHGPSQCPWLLVFLYLFAPTSAFPLNKQESRHRYKAQYWLHPWQSLNNVVAVGVIPRNGNLHIQVMKKNNMFHLVCCIGWKISIFSVSLE